MMVATMTRTLPLLSQRALNRATLARQHLLERTRMPAERLVAHLVAMQAQNPLDPYFAMAARLEAFDPAEASQLLEQRRTVRTGSIRTTLHLQTAEDALAIAPFAMDVHKRIFRNTSFAKAIDGLDLDVVAGEARRLLDEHPRTTNELGKALQARWPDRDASSLAYAIRYAVPVAQLPPRGLWGKTKASTWSTLTTWLEGVEATPTTLDDLVLRYLAAFGPASPADARTWSWFTGLREVFERLRPQLMTFRDEQGRELFDLPDAPRPPEDTPAPPRFLPEYDNLLLSHDDRTRFYDRDYRDRLGWKGTLLLDGLLSGVWRIRDKTLTVELLGSVGAQTRAEVENEAERLRAFAATGHGPLELRFGEVAGPSWPVS
jgi:hypothetical protein